MRFIFSIALRQLLARRRQVIPIVAGIVVGTTVLVATLSLFGGLLDSFVAKIVDVAPHVTMKAESVAGDDADLLVEPSTALPVLVELERNGQREERPRVRNVMTMLRAVERTMGTEITAASPFLATQAIASYGVTSATLRVVGVIPSREAEISDLPRYLTSGSVARLEATRNGMLIGAKAAQDLGVAVGNRVQLVSSGGQVLPVMIVGIYHIGVDATDRAAFVNLRLAQSLEGALPGEASGIGFQIRNLADAPSVARRIEAVTGHATETWQQTNVGIISIFHFLQALFYIVVGFVTVICGFGVANVLITMVLEKERDIAVMKSCGFSSARILAIYLAQGLVIAAAGGLIGLAAGAGAIALMSTIPSGGTAGVGAVETRTFAMGWSPLYFVIAFAGTVVVCVIASIAPARSASRVPPVDVLRGRR